jgi:hypothetical protein
LARFLFGFARRGRVAFLTLTFSLSSRHSAGALLGIAFCSGLTFKALAFSFGGDLESIFLFPLALFFLRPAPSFGLRSLLTLLR